MIISKIQGGLGNQLFQWAYGKSISIKYNTPLYLDILSYQNQFGTKREFSLNKFTNLNYVIKPNESDKVRIQNISDDFKFSEIKVENDSHYYLDGYWQSEKYFKESEQLIRNELKPSDIMLSKLNKTPLIDKNNISLHIRRTDYVSSNGYHPVQSIKYYEDALSIIGEYDNIFIFSDDIKWCKDNLNFTNMIFMEGFSDIEDLYLMSMCKNNIIANSSFSWWGAWLNTNPNKKVISPINWFGDKTNINTSDIIPNDWINI